MDNTCDKIVSCIYLISLFKFQSVSLSNSYAESYLRSNSKYQNSFLLIFLKKSCWGRLDLKNRKNV